MLQFPISADLPECYKMQTQARFIPLKIGNSIFYRSPIFQIGNNTKLALTIPNCCLPLETCRSQGLDCKGCYAKKLHGLRPTAKFHAVTNYLAMAHDTETALHESACFCGAFRHVRLNVTGELTPVSAYFYNRLASACPDTLFLIFTKSVFSNMLNESNIVVKRSAGINYGRETEVKEWAKVMKGYVCPQKKGEKHVCGGKCELCWYTADMPVFFVKH